MMSNDFNEDFNSIGGVPMDIRLETLIKMGYNEKQIRGIGMHSKWYQLKLDMLSTISSAILELKDENYGDALITLSDIIKQMSSNDMRDIMEEIFTDQRFINSYEQLVDELFGTNGLMTRCIASVPEASSEERQIFNEIITTIRKNSSYTNMRNELLSDLDYNEKLSRVSGYIESFKRTHCLKYGSNIALHHLEILAVSSMYIISFLYDIIGIIERESDDIIKEIKNNKKEESVENGENE